MEEFCSHRILPRSFFNCFPRPLQKIFLCSGLLLICIKTFNLQNNSINTAFRSSVMPLQTILDKKCHDLCTTFFLKGSLFPGFGNAITPPSLHYHLSLQPTPKQVAKLEGWGQEDRWHFSLWPLPPSSPGQWKTWSTWTSTLFWGLKGEYL